MPMVLSRGVSSGPVNSSSCWKAVTSKSKESWSAVCVLEFDKPVAGSVVAGVAERGARGKVR